MTPEQPVRPRWAFTLLDRVLSLLAAEYAEPDRAGAIDQLKVVLTDGKGSVGAAELAARLEMSEAAINSATHRLHA